MRNRLQLSVLLLVFCASAISAPGAGQNFKKAVGDVKIGAVEQTKPLLVPYITWGGDMATFHANGGKTTQAGSIFQKQGLSLQLTPGDDFIAQTRDYLSGKTPFLRGTFRMIGMASETIGADPRTRGVVFLQLTWSAGDHLVARGDIRSVADLKGKTIALQTGGPHVGMLDDILKTAKLSWSDVRPHWAKDLTATPDSPAELFRKNPNIAACLVITPDMLGLSAGLSSVGDGSEGTVKGARVLVSTAQMSRSIADVYVCRKDFFDANRPLVEKFAAGYMKACEEVIDLKKQYESNGSTQYTRLLQLTQTIYGKDVIPVPEEDAHGLLSDCTFVGHPGNIAFFTQSQNLHGFEAFQQKALDLAVNEKYASTRSPLDPSGLDFNSRNFIGYLQKTESVKKTIDSEAVGEEIRSLSAEGGLDEREIVSFTINFEPNHPDFPPDLYGEEYQRLVELADMYGNAVFAIRGHSDPTKTLLDVVRAGMAQGVLKRTGSRGNYQYSLDGNRFDLENTKQVIEAIGTGAFDGAAQYNPRQTMQAAINLSCRRAEAVRDSVIAFAKQKGLLIDPGQIQPVGAGIAEPFIAKPVTLEEAARNRRVEFMLIRVDAESVGASDFDF